MTTRKVPTTYSTISAAMAAASDGDIITVATTYAGNETVNVTVDNLTVSAPSSVAGIVLNLASGLQNITLSGASKITVNGNDGANVIVDAAGSANTLNGGGGDDQITVNGKDTVDGGAGNDTITANAAAFTALNGGDGNDLFMVRGSQQTSTQSGSIDGGTGTDTIQAFDLTKLKLTGIEILDLKSGVGAVSATVSQLASFTTITDSLAATNSQFAIALSGAGGTLDLSTKLPGTRSILVYNLNDAGLTSGINVTGTAYGDDLRGSKYADTLNGGAGNDTLDGGLGSNILNGGDGNDTITVNGKDTVDGGAGNDTITVNATVNGAAFTSLSGGDGNDVFVIRDSLPSGSIDGGAGTDTIQASNLTKLTLTGIEILDLKSGVGAVSATVSQLASFTTITDSLAATNSQFSIDLSGAGGTLDLSTKLSGKRSVLLYDLGLTSGITITGTAYGDNLGGSKYADTLNGGSGNDTLDGGLGTNILNGGDGNDQITVNGKDTVDGGAGNDTITANAAAFTSLNGGDGNDVFVVKGSQQSGAVDGGTGTDTIQAYDLTKLTLTGIEILNSKNPQNGGYVSAKLSQLAAFTTITNSSAATNSRFEIALSGAGGTLDLSTRLSDRRSALLHDLNLGLTSGINITGTAYSDNLGGSKYNDTLTGAAGNDTLDGGLGSNILNGGDGNDTITVNGKDTVDGGAGNDRITANVAVFTRLNGGDGNDLFVMASPSGIVDGGAGIDTIQGYDLTKLTLTNIEIFDGNSSGQGGGNVSATISQLTSFTTITDSQRPSNSQFAIALSGAGGTLDLSTKLPGKRSVLVSDNGLKGGITITGTAYGDNLSGSKYADTLNGGAGNDTLDGGLGTNILNGGTGNDLINVRGKDTVDAGAGNDTIVVYADTFTTLKGGDGDDLFVIGSQSGTVDGGAGIDTIQGYDLTKLTLTNVEIFDGNSNGQGGGGVLATVSQLASLTTITDRQRPSNSQFNIALSGAGGTLDLTTKLPGTRSVLVSDYNFGLTGAINITGTAYADDLRGSKYNDTLDGGAGNDTIDGGAGGNDTLIGGAGIDTVSYLYLSDHVLTAGVTVSLAVTGPQDTGSAGTDTLIGFENLTGSSYGDVLIGDSGNNVLNGGAGYDVLEGGAGADILIGGSLQDPSWWRNAASYAHATAGVHASLSDPKTNTGDAAGDTYTFISDLIGSSFDDVLTGDGGSNTLTGGAGDDILESGGAVDQLLGGDGNDTVSYAHSTRAVDASLANGNGDQGDDSYSSIENLTGSSYDDTLTGDEGNNVLRGLGGADHLDGGGGDDRLRGGGGKDVLTGGLGNDTFEFDQRLVAANVSTVTDFTPGSDKIALSLGIFANAGSAPGALDPAAFFAGSAAHDATDRIIYNSATGSLYYDADGTGSIAAITITRLAPHLSVTSSDIELY